MLRWPILVAAGSLITVLLFVSGCGLSADQSVYVDPRWSPDGSRIVFVDGYYNDVQGYVPSGEIVVMNADGSGRKRVADGYNQFPAWSPDGGRIAYAGGRGGEDMDLFVVDADGSDRRRLTDTDEIDEQTPTWSPDGRAIAYVEGRCQLIFCTGGEIMVISLDGSDARNLSRTPGADESEPVWSPDGSMIAFSSDPDQSPGGIQGQLFVMNADGTGRRKLVPSSSQGKETTLDNAQSPAWSPAGTMIAFYGYDPPGVHVIGSDGTAERLVASGAGPSWSPDGRKLVFMGDDDIFTVNVDGTGLRNLTRSIRAESSPEWSPDGRSIVFTDDAWEHIYVMNADGSDVRQLAGEPAETEASEPAARTTGEIVYESAGCNLCHRLAAFDRDPRAGGVVGPDLDELRPDADTVARQVRAGGAEMPSFAESLTPAEIRAVAEYVQVAAGSTSR